MLEKTAANFDDHLSHDLRDASFSEEARPQDTAGSVPAPAPTLVAPGLSEESEEFLHSLLTTPSPSGHEREIQRVVRNRMFQYADLIETDLNGNVFVALNPTATRRVMLAGHCDQIGFAVSKITDDGFIFVGALGGIDNGVLPGSRVTIHTESGPVLGVIGRKPIHKQRAEDRKRVAEVDEVWIDIGAKNGKEAEKLVSVGAPVTFELGVAHLQNGLITGPGLDDRVGLFVVMEAVRLLSEENLSVGVWAVSTVQEELGLRGAGPATFRVDPEVGIAVDVCHATDNPGFRGEKEPAAKLDGGPVIYRGPNINPVLFDKLIETATSSGLPYQPGLSTVPMSNDARAIQTTRNGVATASIGIPNRYMHTQVEVCALEDLSRAAHLLAEFIKRIDAQTDFRPL